MRDLITRLEAATGPDRGLDDAIAEAMGWPDAAFTSASRLYTASIDAALTLVPEGWAWMLGGPCGNLRPGAELRLVERRVFTTAATPAIALCIAALRAREAAHA